MRVRRPGPTLAALVLLLSLAACTGDPIAPGPLTPSPSPAGSATPSARASEDPLADETPQEFLRRWVEVQNRMQTTGDTARFLALSDGCADCEAIAQRLSAIYDKGGWVKTSGWTITSIQAPRRLSKTEIGMDFSVSSAPTEFVEAAGAAVQHLDGASRVHMLIQAKRSGGRWKATLLTQVAQ